MIARIGDSRPINLLMHYSGLVAFILIDIVIGEYPLPSGTEGALLTKGRIREKIKNDPFVPVFWILKDG
jgi:hypothetical protein